MDSLSDIVVRNKLRYPFRELALTSLAKEYLLDLLLVPVTKSVYK